MTDALREDLAVRVVELETENARLKAERDEESILMLGGTYVTQEGKHVTMVKMHNSGTPYETLEDELGVNRYSRRLDDMGRATGTAHDYSDPLNIQRPIRAIALREIPRPESAEKQLAEVKAALAAIVTADDEGNRFELADLIVKARALITEGKP